MTPGHGDDGGPKVAVHPPLLFLLGLLAAAALELAAPLGPGLAQGNWRPVAAGLGIGGLGAALAALSVRRFAAAGTPFRIGEPSEALVTGGIYRWTRNPIYIGLITLYFGLSVALASLWGLILLPGLVAVLHQGVVLREEVYLEGKFGKPYRDYVARVPRWL